MDKLFYLNGSYCFKKKEWICILYGRFESILDKFEKGWINLVCGILRLKKWYFIIKWVENY